MEERPIFVIFDSDGSLTVSLDWIDLTWVLYERFSLCTLIPGNVRVSVNRNVQSRFINPKMTYIVILMSTSPYPAPPTPPLYIVKKIGVFWMCFLIIAGSHWPVFQTLHLNISAGIVDFAKRVQCMHILFCKSCYVIHWLDIWHSQVSSFIHVIH